MLNLSIFVERLKDLMFDSHVSVQDLGLKLDIEPSLIYRCLRGKGFLQLRHLIKLADHFCCPLDYLLGLENDIYTTTFLPLPPFGDRLIALYGKTGLTEYRVMRDTHLSRTSLHDWRLNLRLPSPENLLTLATYFDCSLDYLLGRTH